jgi:PAS domain S-box-containing protein
MIGPYPSGLSNLPKAGRDAYIKGMRTRNGRVHRKSPFFFPDSSVLAPLVILFATTLKGLSLPEALHSSAGLFFSGSAGLVTWLQIILLNVVVYAYAAPIFKLHIACLREACQPSEPDIDRAMRRLDGLSRFVIFASIAFFAAGGLLRYHFAQGSQEGFVKTLFIMEFFESSVTGFFVGVILSLQFENRLYGARATVLGLESSVGARRGLRYSSFYSRILLVMCAIALSLSIQVFSSASGFFTLGTREFSDSEKSSEPRQAASKALVPSSPGLVLSSPLSGSEFIVQYGHLEGVKKVLGVFSLRLGIFAIFIVQLLVQLKQLIKSPLAMVTERLKALNSPEPGKGKVIEILKNDEFGRVYRLINSLILRQRDELEISRRRLEGIVESAADPIIAVDSKGAIRIFNPAAESAFGYAREEIMGKSLDIILPDIAERQDPLSSVSSCVLGGLARRDWRRKDGGLIPMESHVSRDCEREEAWTSLILRDVSAQAEIEERLTSARLEAENANRMKSEFLANMSHELRTPLNAILGFTQLMADDRNLTEAQRDRIGVISRSGEHLLALINDILDISKIEAGKMELHPTAFDLPRFVDDLGEMFALKCRKKGLTLYVEKLEGLPRYVEADLGKLRQVMINLLGNAVKFTAEGGVSVIVGRDGQRIRFAVRDTGRGIPESERELIMLPFVQASTTDHEGGTGLGLAISSRYIAMMGGTLEVESVLGEGSTFYFSIALEERQKPPEEASDEAGAIFVEEGKPSTVLVVDDQPTNRLVLKEMLERAGFSVIEAVDGREAVERARESAPDIVFMDIKMPVMDGYEAVAALKGDPATAGIRVFALTASAFSHDEARIAAAGFDGFLAKPFKLSALYRLIRERGGLRLRVEAARPADQAPPSGEVDFAAASAALGETGLAEIGESALINDFGSLSAHADALRGSAPAFASALRSAAASYDEEAIASLLKGLRSAAGKD